MREYETVIVLDPALDDARVEQEIEAVSSVINQGGGEVIEVQRWGRRRMAYEVRKKREGNYSLIRFMSDRDVLTELKRRFSLNESLLRHQTVHSMGPSAPPSSEGFSHHDRRGDGYGDRREGRGHSRDRFDDRQGAGGSHRAEASRAGDKAASPDTKEPPPAAEAAPAGNEATANSTGETPASTEEQTSES